jgi:hypothetical protein
MTLFIYSWVIFYNLIDKYILLLLNFGIILNISKSSLKNSLKILL